MPTEKTLNNIKRQQRRRLKELSALSVGAQQHKSVSISVIT